MKLTELKNIGGYTAQMLKDIGIDSVERLAEHDVFDLWINLKRIHPKQVQEDLLWELEGAILNTEPDKIPHSRIKELRAKLKNWQAKT